MRGKRSKEPTLYPRLLVLVGVATCIIGLIMTVTVGRVLSTLALEVAASNLQASLEEQVEEIAAANGDGARLTQVADGVWGRLGDRQWVLGAEGRILASGGQEHRDPSEVLRAAEELLATGVADTGQVGARNRQVLAAVEMPSGEIFALEYRPRVSIRNRGMWWSILLSALVAAMACSLVFSRWLARPIHRRLETLQRVIHRYGQGDPTVRIEMPSRPHEFSSVYSSFNTMADRIEELEASEEQRRSRQRALLAGLAHDVNTPMTVIRGNAEVLLDHTRLDERQKDIVSDLVTQSLYVQALLDDLLTITRKDEDEIPLARERLVLDGLIDRLVDTFSPAASRRQIALFGDGRGLDVWADPIRLQQILTNLIRNALLHGRGASVIEVSARQEGDRIVLAVSDDGPGVPADQIPRLFEAYRVGEGSNTPGFGLGLAIVRLLATQHGGGARYLEREEGACFEVWLPASFQEPEP